jgi:hypothetical protein
MDLNLSLGSNASSEMRLSPRDGDGDTPPFRRSPHHLLEPEQQDELQRKWAKQKEYQRVLKQQIGERQAERSRSRQLQEAEEEAERLGLTRGLSPPPGGRESAEPAATAGQYADWRGYKKSHGRVSPEVRRGMEQQQYRGQQSREPEQAVAVIRDTVVHDTSRSIEAMKSDVDRMLQQARREAAEKTSSEVEEVTREVRREAERAIRDAVARESGSGRPGSPPHSPVKPARPNFSAPNPGAGAAAGAGDADSDFSGVDDHDLASTWPGPARSPTMGASGGDRLSQTFDGRSPERGGRPRSPLIGSVPLSNGVAGVPRRRGTFGEGGMSPEAQEEMKRKWATQKETADALEAQIDERQRERERVKREEQERERRENEEYEEILATRMTQESDDMERRRTLSVERGGPEEMSGGGGWRGQSPPQGQGRTGRSPSPHARVVPRSPPRLPPQATALSSSGPLERPNFSAPNPAAVSAGGGGGGGGVGSAGGGQLLELSAEQWARLDQLLSITRAPSPARSSSNGVSPQMEAWCLAMENRVAAAESRIEVERSELAEGLGELGRHQAEQANVLAGMGEQLDSMAETVREICEQMSHHQLDQESMVLASLTDVEEVAAEVQQRLRAEQERAKATTTSAVQKLEVAEKQVRMAMAARDGLLRFCLFILHLIVCRLLFDFRECVFVVAYRGNTRMLRVLLSGSAGWRGEATGRHAETT